MIEGVAKIHKKSDQKYNYVAKIEVPEGFGEIGAVIVEVKENSTERFIDTIFIKNLGGSTIEPGETDGLSGMIRRIYTYLVVLFAIIRLVLESVTRCIKSLFRAPPVQQGSTTTGGAFFYIFYYICLDSIFSFRNIEQLDPNLIYLKILYLYE